MFGFKGLDLSGPRPSVDDLDIKVKLLDILFKIYGPLYAQNDYDDFDRAYKKCISLLSEG